jgi:hypothetical protein
MAKISLSVTLKKDNGSQLGSSISSGDKSSFTEARDAVAAVIAGRVATAQQDAADLEAAQAAFNS